MNEIEHRFPELAGIDVAEPPWLAERAAVRQKEVQAVHRYERHALRGPGRVFGMDIPAGDVVLAVVDPRRPEGELGSAVAVRFEAEILDDPVALADAYRQLEQMMRDGPPKDER